MLFSTLVKDYVRWHYGEAFKELFHVWCNFLWFIIHFFSLPQLSSSLIAPWKRMTEERTKGFDFETFLSYLIINLLSRVVGFILRSAVILVGLTVLLLTVLSGFSIFLFWVVAPVAIVALLALGVSLVISNTIV